MRTLRATHRCAGVGLRCGSGIAPDAATISTSPSQSLASGHLRLRHIKCAALMK
jgi:hypothetical protein